MTSPTQRTLESLRRHDYIVQVVERWVPQARKQIDLFGSIDLIYLSAGENGKIVGVQVTSGTNHAARLNKALAEPRIRRWIECGGGFEVRSWSKMGAHGKRKSWQERVQNVTLADFAAPTVAGGGG